MTVTVTVHAWQHAQCRPSVQWQLALGDVWHTNWPSHGLTEWRTSFVLTPGQFSESRTERSVTQWTTEMAASDSDSAPFSLPDVDPDTFLESPARDHRSDLPLGAVSLLLRYHLPLLELERHAHHRRTAAQHQQSRLCRLDMPEVRRPSSRTGDDLMTQVSFHVTGSSVEGLSVPAHRKAACGPSLVVSDLDVMMEMCQLSVEVCCHKNGPLYMDETRASHPGYAWIRVKSSECDRGMSGLVQSAPNSTEEPEYFLSHEELKRVIHSAQVPEAVLQLIGPALTVSSKNKTQNDLDVFSQADLVMSLPVLGAPPAFAAWLQRVATEGVAWPSAEVLAEIREHGQCFLVGTGHISSEVGQLEWRLSFSDPERRLAQSLTAVQRKVFLMVKLLHKCYLHDLGVLKTYHLKTLMFWELEKSQTQDWSEQTVFGCILRFLDRIEDCVKEQNIPSYFDPSNNLISHIDPELVIGTLASVRRIRDDPLRHLYGIDKHVTMGFSTLEPLCSLHRPALNALGVNDATQFRRRLAHNLLRQARDATSRDLMWPLRCADLLRDVHRLLCGKHGACALWSDDDWLARSAIFVFATLQSEDSHRANEIIREPANDNPEQPAENQTDRRTREIIEDEAAFLDAAALLCPDDHGALAAYDLEPMTTDEKLHRSLDPDITVIYVETHLVDVLVRIGALLLPKTQYRVLLPRKRKRSTARKTAREHGSSTEQVERNHLVKAKITAAPGPIDQTVSLKVSPTETETETSLTTLPFQKGSEAKHVGERQAVPSTNSSQQKCATAKLATKERTNKTEKNQGPRFPGKLAQGDDNTAGSDNSSEYTESPETRKKLSISRESKLSLARQGHKNKSTRPQEQTKTAMILPLQRHSNKFWRSQVQPIGTEAMISRGQQNKLTRQRN